MIGAHLASIWTPVELGLLDLLMCGDNILVVAVACGGLPADLRVRAMKLGIAGALAARFVLTAAATFAFSIPGLKLVAAMLLILIALNLASGEHDTALEADGRRRLGGSARNFVVATMTIILADVLMSLDNAVALAAIADGNLLFLAIGLALCVPLLFYGSNWVIGLMATAPTLVLAGAAFLGWIAGNMIVSDPLLQAGIATQSQAFPYLLPPLLAGYVVIQTQVAAAPRQP